MAENEIRVAVGGDSSNVAITAGAATLGNKKRIHKIPPHLRSKEDSDYVYDPKVVSIGPYHHGKPELQLVQRIKHKVLDNFISNSSSSQQKQDYEFYFKKMLEVVHRARSCYIMESISEFDDLEFAEMMLLDGCFLLNHFLVTTDYGDDFARAREYYSPLDITTLMTIDVAAGIIFTERDTILLENQIPLWIIKLLFKARYGNGNPPHTWKQLLYMRSQQVVWEEIVFENVDELEKHVMLRDNDDEDDDDAEPLHLLEFYHMLMVSRPSSSSSGPSNSSLIFCEQRLSFPFLMHPP
nr:UPF0481 protein At3g47200-like [Ipomoea batatas]GME10914.1 UPF0481 protein At3g47200-like [Ipomoea batatas]